MKFIPARPMVFAACLFWACCSQAQDQVLNIFNSRVFPDSSKPPIYVKNVRIEFIFAGYGVYLPSDYPTITSIPLESGERVSFENIAEIQCRPRRVFWKKYIEPVHRSQYNDIDAEGYRHWSDIEIEVLLKDWDGDETRARMLRPEVSDAYLIGKTDRGDFRLQLDQENGKTVRMEFEPLFIMQCTNDINHLFPNAQWRFCPLCGASLKKISKVKQP